MCIGQSLVVRLVGSEDDSMKPNIYKIKVVEIGKLECFRKKNQISTKTRSSVYSMYKLAR